MSSQPPVVQGCPAPHSNPELLTPTSRISRLFASRITPLSVWRGPSTRDARVTGPAPAAAIAIAQMARITLLMKRSSDGALSKSNFGPRRLDLRFEKKVYGLGRGAFRR